MSEFKPTPFKQAEIEKCALCGEGVGHDQMLTFYRVRSEQFVLDVAAISQQAGLEQMMGNAALAAIMGPDKAIAHGMGEQSALLCLECAMLKPIVAILEYFAKQEGAENEKA